MLTISRILAQKPASRIWGYRLADFRKSMSDDAPLPFATLISAVDLQESIWSLRCLPADYEGAIRLLACDFARSVFDLVPPGEDPPRLGVEAMRGFVAGTVTEAEMTNAAQAVWSTWATAARAQAMAMLDGHVVARDAEERADEAAGWARVAAARAADHVVRAAVAALDAARAARAARAAASWSMVVGGDEEREKQAATLLDWAAQRGI